MDAVCMKIRIARTAGFCMGVRRAVDMALDLQRQNPPQPIVTYGPLIHNPQTLEILRSKGIREIRSLDEVTEGTVVIRAHGVSPQEKEILRSKNVKIIDATCPRVARVQAIIKKHALKGHFCLIVGDEDHPEVRGLMGFATPGGGIVVSSPVQAAMLKNVPWDRDICVVAQTTQDLEGFERAVACIREQATRISVYNTICDSTRKRQAEVERLATQADLIVVVGGKGSANTRRLAQVAETHGVPAIQVETEEELPSDALQNAEVVGVTAGASTPNWQIRNVIDRLREIGMTQNGGVTDWLRRIAEVLVMTYVIAALAGTGLTAACLTLQQKPMHWLPLVISTLFVFSMHILHRLQDRSGAVRFNTPQVAAFYGRYRRVLWALGVLSSLGAAAFSFFMGVAHGLFLVGMQLTGFLFSVRVLPEKWFPRARWRSLRELPGAKSPIVALGWGSAVAVLPVIGSLDQGGWASLAAAFCFAAGMVLWRGLFSDLLDIQGDRIVGYETLPILLGPRRTRFLLGGLLGLLGVGLFIAATLGIIAKIGYVLTMNVALFGLLYGMTQRRHVVDRLVVEGLTDGNLLLAGLLSIVYG